MISASESEKRKAWYGYIQRLRKMGNYNICPVCFSEKTERENFDYHRCNICNTAYFSEEREHEEEMRRGTDMANFNKFKNREIVIDKIVDLINSGMLDKLIDRYANGATNDRLP